MAGAGLAGLTAARDLEADGASVTVVEARDRAGGRVHTLRGFDERQHAEGGADLIEGEQALVLELARALRLQVVPILRRGWGFTAPTAAVDVESAARRGRSRKQHDGSTQRFATTGLPQGDGIPPSPRRWHVSR